MRSSSFLPVALFCFLLIVSCNGKQTYPQVKHVILIGMDGMGAYDFQRAATPEMNRMAANGALSVKARCVLESSSSQNWMSMLTGAIPEQHGVTSNEWEPDDHMIEPILKNKKGFFPSVFDDIKNQKPGCRAYMFYEWEGLGRMFDLTVPDKVEWINNGVEVINKGIEAFFKDKPEFLFIAVDETDHAGHVYGHESEEFHECITKYDSIIGSLAKRLEATGMLQNTVVIITADHGGLKKGHGGDSPYEMTIPVLLYGGPVTKGKLVEKSGIIADIAPTVAGLLGIKMPEECVGKFIKAAFEPATDRNYSPIPVIVPRSGLYKNSVEVSMKTDVPEAKIYYTLDGSAPVIGSVLYQKPFTLGKSALIRAVSVTGNSAGMEEHSSVRVVKDGDKPAVHYRFYTGYNGINVPDFTKLGRPGREGDIYEFSLDGLVPGNLDHFAVEFTSSLQVDEAGGYLFTISSDDGSRLFIDDKPVVNNDGSHSTRTSSGRITLEKGKHKIRVGYFDDSDSEFFELSWRTPSGLKELIPFSRFVAE